MLVKILGNDYYVIWEERTESEVIAIIQTIKKTMWRFEKYTETSIDEDELLQFIQDCLPTDIQIKEFSTVYVANFDCEF